MGRHSTPDPAVPPSSPPRGVGARRRLLAAVLGTVLAVLLGLVLWVVNRPDGGRDALADGTGGGATASSTGVSPSDAVSPPDGSPSPSPSAGVPSPTPVASAGSVPATRAAAATPSPRRPPASPSPARPATRSATPGAAGLTAAFHQGQTWQGGYEAEYTITNRGTVAVTGWTVAVTFSGTVHLAYWDADAVTGTNNRITFTAKSYNATVPVGGSVSFGLVVTGSPPATPVACAVNGRSC